MTLDNWLEQFDQLPPTSARKIAVLGAGIAGLVAAEQLARRGHEVTVFEADGRVGGRILTHRYAGCHAELGAMRIPASHNLTLAYSERAKVDLQPFYNADPHTLFRLRGATIPQADTAAWLDLYAVSDNERQWLMRRPNYLLTKIIMKLSQGLNEQDIQAIRNSDIAHASERVQQLDRVALRDFALQHLDTQDSVMLLGAQHYLTEVWHCSCIALLKEVFGARTEGLTQAQPGMDQIPLRLFEMLGKYENIHFDMPTQVTAITTTDQHVSLEFADAPPQRFERALCTIPFPVLKQMSLTGLSAGKQAAINSFTYLASTKVMLNFKASFWQQGEQGLAGGISVSDDISGQIVYPSIPHLQHSSPETAELPAQYPGIFAGEFRPSDRNPGGPGILMSYTWGESARRLGVLPPAQRLEVVLRTVAALHGQAAMDAFDGGTSIAWDQHRWSGGAFGAPLVGDLLLYREAAIRPEAALYFAGEHLSGDPGWIQGAIESALTTSKALLADLR